MSTEDRLPGDASRETGVGSMAEFRAKFGRFPEEGPPELAPGFQIRRVPAPGWGPVGALLDLVRSLFLRRDQLSVPMQERREPPARVLSRELERQQSLSFRWMDRALSTEDAARQLVDALDAADWIADARVEVGVDALRAVLDQHATGAGS